jgi:hypothetical protein
MFLGFLVRRGGLKSLFKGEEEENVFYRIEILLRNIFEVFYIGEIGFGKFSVF